MANACAKYTTSIFKFAWVKYDQGTLKFLLIKEATVASVQELLEPVDVGRVLGVGPQRVTQLAEAGKIPVFGRTLRGVRLFRAIDLQRVLKARAERPHLKRTLRSARDA